MLRVTCYRPLYVSGRSWVGSMNRTGTDGGQNLPRLIISSARRRRRRCTVACQKRLVWSAAPDGRTNGRTCSAYVRQNVKHFDVFMTASVRRVSRLAGCLYILCPVHDRIPSSIHRDATNSFRWQIIAVYSQSRTPRVRRLGRCCSITAVAGCGTPS